MSAANFFQFTQSITADGTYVSDAKDIEQYSIHLVLAAITTDLTDGSYVVTLQHTPDAGTNWVDVDSLTAITTEKAATKSIADHVISIIRLKVVATSVTTGATVNAKLFWGKLR